jgi:aminoglycoside phosphotransferase family enzyme/predicted kinase
VLLAGEHVYKIKKPVDFGFVDYSTLAKRRHFCHQEVTLNRELCEETYLGVVAIRETDGRFQIDGPGRTVEYAVHMRRLPAERMLDRLIAAPRVGRRAPKAKQLVERVAGRLAAFHSEAKTGPRIAADGHRAMQRSWWENFEQWAPFVGKTISPEQDQMLRAYGAAFLARRQEVLRRRVEELRIRDCHGDLRADAVCFPHDDEVCIFDRLEFSARLRYTDVAGDVGFLAMDLEHRERPDLARAFVDRYVEVSGDADLPAILDFYKCYRACVRGKVESLRSIEPEVGERDRRAAKRAAERYFALACRYAATLPPGLLIITCGLSASGKSSLARRLAERHGMEVFSSDTVRKELAGVAPGDHTPSAYQKGIYTPKFTARTYDALFKLARPLLEAGRSVVLDATFRRAEDRLSALRLAEETGARFLCLECRSSDETAAARLSHRLRAGADPSDARWDIYLEQKRSFEPVVELPPESHIIIDTEQSLTAEARTVEKALRSVMRKT